LRVRGFPLVAGVAGLALLAAACGGGGDESTPTATSTPSAGDGAELTAEQAIQRVLETLQSAPDQRADPSTATARRMRDCETDDVMRWEGRQWGGPPENPSEKLVWLVKVRGEFPGIMQGGLNQDTTPHAGALIWILKSNGLSGTVRFDEREHEGPELSVGDIVKRVLDEIAGPPFPQVQLDVSAVTAASMTEREALEALEREGGSPDLAMRVLTDDPAWLVEIRGEFSGFIGYGLTPDPSPPRAGTWIQILGDGGAGGILFDEREEGPELPREDIVERALDEMGISSENRPDASTVTLTRATFREALQTLRRAGAPRDFSERAGPDGPVWLFEVRGQFVGMCPGPPRPGRYFLVLGPDGSVQSSGFIPGAAPTP